MVECGDVIKFTIHIQAHPLSAIDLSARAHVD